MAENSCYTLRFLHSDRMHGAGERVMASSADIHVGQRQDCEVRLENPTGFADELIAVIRPCGAVPGWQIVAVSAFVPLLVNGAPVDVVHYLSDGDRIGFEGLGQELLFHICREDSLHAGESVRMMPPSSFRVALAFLIAVPLILFGILGGVLIRSNRAEKRLSALLEQAAGSVWKVSVDSVYYVMHTPSGETRLRACSYIGEEGQAPSGTAFITVDSTVLTARHCIEPWINDISVFETDPDSIVSLPSRWALEAETWNQLHAGDTSFSVVGRCTLSRGEGSAEESLATFLSSDFRYDPSRDDIVEFGDFNREYYWRSLMQRHGRSDMMLGDIASARGSVPGTLVLVPSDELPGLLKPRTGLYFMGYPAYQVSGFEQTEGTVRRQYSEGEMIAHDGRLTHGYSGGPALVLRDGGLCVAGVISVIDGAGGERMYSVPVSEAGGR